MRLIDADALSDILKQMIEKADVKSQEYVREPVVAHHFEMLKQQIEEILTGISESSTIKPERKTGQWIPQDRNKTSGNTTTCVYYYPVCSECGHTGDFDMNYCPSCGAKMGVEYD